MKKISLCLAAVLGVFTLSAAELAINGAFDKMNSKTGLPEKWFFNAWAGYKPSPAVKVIKDGKANALEFTGSKSKNGFGISNFANFPCKKGQVVTVTARVKGQGTMFFQLQTFGAKKWTGLLPAANVTLTPDWKDVKVTLPVDDVKGKDPTVKAMFTFGAAAKTQNLTISSIKADLK